MALDLRGRLIPTFPSKLSTHDYLVNFYHPNPQGLRSIQRNITSQDVIDAAQHLERLGFDSVLIAQNGHSPDIFALAAWALAATKTIRTAISLRVGLTAPTIAANALATLDRLSEGRTLVHIIQGNSDEGQRADGDFLPKPERYLRAHEYLDIFKRILETEEAFDYSGRYYSVEGAYKVTRSVQSPRPPIAAAGASPEGLDFVSRYADVYAVTTEPLAETRALLDQVKAAALEQGRKNIAFWRDSNFILAATDEEAQQRAERIAADIRTTTGGVAVQTQSVGQARALSAVDRAEWHDRALYTGINRAGGRGGIPFVGSPKTAADAVLDYYDLGIETFSIGVPLVSEEDDRLATELLEHIRNGVKDRASKHHAA